MQQVNPKQGAHARAPHAHPRTALIIVPSPALVGMPHTQQARAKCDHSQCNQPRLLPISQPQSSASPGRVPRGLAFILATPLFLPHDLTEQYMHHTDAHQSANTSTHMNRQTHGACVTDTHTHTHARVHRKHLHGYSMPCTARPPA